MFLTEDGCRTRRQRLIEAVDADVLIISDPRHIFYFTNFLSNPQLLGSWGHNHLLIDCRTGKTTLLIHSFARMMLRDAEYVDDVVVWRWYDGKQNPPAMLFPQGIEELNKLIKEMNPGRVGYEAGWLPMGADVTNAVDITPQLLSMRRRKDEDELILIRDAVRATETGHKAAREFIQAGVTELDVYNTFYSAVVNEAGGAVQPHGDFAAGERAFGGGGLPQDNVLKEGDLMILDVFPIVNGYRADFTATVAVSDTLTEKQAQLEAALHAAIHAGEAELRPGMAANAVHKAVSNALADGGFGPLTHHAGHGLGLGHPEAPFFVADSHDVLVAGDIVTLEPGAYNRDEQYGARIENNYLVTETGPVRLTYHNTAFLR